MISFHSLEDRLVKRAMRDASRPPQGDPRMLPDNLTKSKLRLIGKAIKAGPEELQMNPEREALYSSRRKDRAA